MYYLHKLCPKSSEEKPTFFGNQAHSKRKFFLNGLNSVGHTLLHVVVCVVILWFQVATFPLTLEHINFVCCGILC